MVDRGPLVPGRCGAPLESLVACPLAEPGQPGRFKGRHPRVHPLDK